MGTTRTAETKSLEKAQTEDKAVEAPVEAPVQAEAADKSTVTFIVAHPIAKAVLVAGGKGDLAPGDELELDPHTAAHFARVGAGRLA